MVPLHQRVAFFERLLELTHEPVLWEHCTEVREKKIVKCFPLLIEQQPRADSDEHFSLVPGGNWRWNAAVFLSALRFDSNLLF
jgi:hypothetical protein